MAHQNPTGRTTTTSDEHRPSWRLHDQGSRDDRDDGRSLSERDRGRHDPREQDDAYRTSDRHGQGHSGDAAGRHGEDRSLGRYEDRSQQGQGYYYPERARDREYQGERGSFGGAEQHGYGTSGEERGRAQPTGYRGYGVGQGGYGTHASTQSGFGLGQDVRGPHRGKGPQGWQRSDERIRDMICEALTDDEYIDATHVDVAVTNGEVTLTGTVPDRQTKRMAEDLVERVSGVSDVQNRLRIERDRSQLSSRAGAKTEAEMTDRSKHRA